MRSLGAGSHAPEGSPTEIVRALEIALDSLRTDRVRTRAAVVALAIAMVVLYELSMLACRVMLAKKIKAQAEADSEAA